jgi:hypothetical protein
MIKNACKKAGNPRPLTAVFGLRLPEVTAADPLAEACNFRATKPRHERVREGKPSRREAHSQGISVPAHALPCRCLIALRSQRSQVRILPRVLRFPSFRKSLQIGGSRAAARWSTCSRPYARGCASAGARTSRASSRACEGARESPPRPRARMAGQAGSPDRIGSERAQGAQGVRFRTARPCSRSAGTDT